MASFGALFAISFAWNSIHPINMWFTRKDGFMAVFLDSLQHWVIVVQLVNTLDGAASIYYVMSVCTLPYYFLMLLGTVYGSVVYTSVAL